MLTRQLRQMVWVVLLGWGLSVSLPSAGVAATVHDASAEAGFYFVQITDPHIGDADHLERLHGVVAQVNALPMPLACVVVTGDMVNGEIDSATVVAETLAAFARLTVPVHYVVGNNDIRREHWGAAALHYQQAFGAMAATAEYHGVVFAMLNTLPLAGGYSAPGWAPLEQAQRLFVSAGEKPLLVFHHIPEVEDFYNNRIHPGWPEPQCSEWLALLQRHDVRAVVTGHFHRDEFHYLGTVPLFVAAPVAGYWGRQASFRLYHYQQGRLTYRTVYLTAGG